MGAPLDIELWEKLNVTLDTKLGTNNDVKKGAKQYEIQDAKLGVNKGI